MLRIFSPRKVRRLRPGLNPRTWVPETTEAAPTLFLVVRLSESSKYIYLLEWFTEHYHVDMTYRVAYWALPCGDDVESGVLGITMWRWHTQWSSGHYHSEMAYRVTYCALPCEDGILTTTSFFQCPLFWDFALLGSYASHVGSCLPKSHNTLLVPPSWYHLLLFSKSVTSSSFCSNSILLLRSHYFAALFIQHAKNISHVVLSSVLCPGVP
jgi:hypothetical protein